MHAQCNVCSEIGEMDNTNTNNTDVEYWVLLPSSSTSHPVSCPSLLCNYQPVVSCSYIIHWSSGHGQGAECLLSPHLEPVWWGWPAVPGPNIAPGSLLLLLLLLLLLTPLPVVSPLPTLARPLLPLVTVPTVQLITGATVDTPHLQWPVCCGGECTDYWDLPRAAWQPGSVQCTVYSVVYSGPPWPPAVLFTPPTHSSSWGT